MITLGIEKFELMEFEIVTKSVEETIELGREFGSQLKGAEIIGLVGPLGSGKTNFVKGVAVGLGAEDSRAVNSPTFVIVNEYTGRLDVYHIDAYRINSADEFEMLGFDDYCWAGSVVLIEWADKVMASLANVNLIEIEFSHVEQFKRRIYIKNPPSYIVFKQR